MNSLKIIIKSLSKRKLSVFLIGIQVALSIWFFITIACSIQKFLFLGSMVETQLNYKSGQIVHIKLNPDTTTTEKFLSFREEAMKQQDISFIGSYRTNKSIRIDTKEKNEAIAKLQNDITSRTNIDMLSGDRLPVIYMEKGINSLVNMNIDEGRSFTNDDFKSSTNSPIPVLAGYKLIQYNVFNIGEQIEDKQNKRLYKIVGVLSNNSIWFRFSPDQGEFMNLDDKLIIPFNDSMYNESLKGMMITNYYSILKSEKNSERVLLELNNIADKTGLQVEMNTLKEELEIQRDEIKKENSMWVFFSLFFIIMTSLSLVFVMVSSIVARKREFGIRAAIGASLLQIQRLVIGEILVVVITASILAILYSIYSINVSRSSWYDLTLNTYYISPSIIIIAIMIAIIITIIPAIVVSYKFKEMQPSELIGGNE